MFLRTIALEVNIARIKGELSGATPEQRFDQFVDALCRPERRRAFFCEYGVLARQVHLCLAHWASFGIEFFTHLAEDWRDVQTTLADGVPLGRLAAVEGSDGDGHRSGRCVLKIAFTSGLRVVYKPRSLAVDRHFGELVEWFNAHAAESPVLHTLRTAKVLDRNSRGWAEFISAGGCESREEVVRFFVRQGSFLALLYSLQAIDFHSENLIASGEHPVLVDLEALLHPDYVDLNAANPFREPALKPWLTSLMRLGLLPERLDSSDNTAGIDISALGDRAGQVLAQPVPLISDIATDAMHVSYERPAIEPENSLPTLAGSRADATQFVAEIIAGFEATYRLLLRHREEFLQDVLPKFARDPIRFIAVATHIYDRILRTSFHPDYLRDAIERERILDRIWRHRRPDRPVESLFRAEKADMANGDIPFFWTTADSRELIDSRGHAITGLLAESGYALTLDRVRQMSESDLERQIWTIRASFATVTIGHGDGTWPTYVPTREPAAVEPPELVALARRVGDRIIELAHIDRDNAGWLGVTLIRDREWQILPVGVDLYNGLSGIALFLAQLGRVTGDLRYERLARQAANSIGRQFETRYSAGEPMPVGVYGGTSGAIYAFAHLARLWQAPEWLQRAEEITTLIGHHVAADQRFDLIDGSAGAIMALLTLYRERPSDAVLRVARACGDHLLANAREADGAAGLCWSNPIPSFGPLTGISHGAGGIALALLQLGHVTGDSRYTDAGRAALRYERSTFAKDEGNWPDLRNIGSAPAGDSAAPGPRRFMTTWCHGAPGIGMSRILMQRVLNDPDLSVEISTAVRTTLQAGFGTNHCLCHGDLGNLDLIQAGLQGRERADAVSRLGATIVHSIRRDGWLTGIPQGVESPSLMCGIAGIGYGLLRLLDPVSVPSVLMLDPPAPMAQ
jgi:type 2 lantibiotic biosynthesis protein LanM